MGEVPTLWTLSGATYTTISIPVLPGGKSEIAYDLNNARQVVGTSGTSGVESAFLWTTSTGSIALPRLAGDDLNGSANAINATGVIVGANGYTATDSTVHSHAIVWMPGVDNGTSFTAFNLGVDTNAFGIGSSTSTLLADGSTQITFKVVGQIGGRAALWNVTVNRSSAGQTAT